MRATVHVLATTVEGTRAALVAARQLVNEGPIPLVVPSTMSASIEATSTLVSRVRDVVRELGESVQVRVCLCRTPADAARQLIPPHATVVVGGTTRWWWPSREARIAASLRRFGRQVVFADLPGGKTHPSSAFVDPGGTALAKSLGQREGIMHVIFAARRWWLARSAT